MSSRKGKKEKPVKTPEVTQVEEQLNKKELVPGKGFYESHWLRILETDSVDSFVRGLIDDVFELAFAEGYHNLCDTQASSHAVQWAKKKMIEVVECYFLSHDTGQSAMSDVMWSEDSEPPLPTVIDSWARGMMPLEALTEEPPHTVPDDETVVAAEAKEESEDSTVLAPESQDVIEENFVSSRGSDGSSELHHFQATVTRNRPRAHRQREISLMTVHDTPPEQHRTPLTSQSHVSTLHSHTPPTPSKRLAVSPIIAAPHDSIPLPHKRMDVITRPCGSVRYTRKLNPKTFPSQSIKPHVKLSQASKTVPIHEEHVKRQSPTETKCQRYHHMRWTNMSLTSPQHAHNKAGGLQRVESSRFPKKPVLPLLVDLIDPVPGVTVRTEGRSLASSSHIRTKVKLHHSHLKPITPQEVCSKENEGKQAVRKSSSDIERRELTGHV